MRRSSSSFRMSEDDGGECTLPLGSEYDFTIDLQDTNTETPGSRLAIDLSMLDGKSCIDSSSHGKESRVPSLLRSGDNVPLDLRASTSTLGTSQCRQLNIDSSRGKRSLFSAVETARSNFTSTSSKTSDSKQLNLTDHILIGANENKVLNLGIFSSRQVETFRTTQPQVRLNKFEGFDAHQNKQIPSGSGFANGKIQTYVFGFKKPREYIPKPFVSSHRPKTGTKIRRANTSLEHNVSEFRLTSKIRLTPRRVISFMKDEGICSSFINSSIYSL